MTAPWPRARPEAGNRAVVKTTAEDFQVVELPAVAPCGSGEHLWLNVRKRGLSTAAAAEWLAAAFAVPETAVGYAGMKDKHAVTEQWFSVQTPRDADGLPAHPDIELLAAARHSRKLRRGDLAGNRFRIRLRAVAGETWPAALAAARDAGVPNYFGSQRFGRDNLERARRWLPARRRRRLSAFRRGLYLSVLRSFLFNEVLAWRVANGSWNEIVPGERPLDLPAPAQAAGCAGADRPGAEQVPSGPLWGRGRPAVTDAALAMESRALAPHGALCEGLEHAGLRQERRSLVLRAADLSWHADADALEVSFSLPPGTYATALLGEAFTLSDGSGVRP
ncbi:MAG: tRNA pseudouridine(13) synthase TruD [Gammaproteobacteria bacterium]|nr:tRNA pseudouridine(13) synthase TruD [Gammaproteobacteria bacterium]